MILVILKLLVVLVFLIMFVRRPRVVWGIGLLTVTTAVLLDTLLGTFDREELLAELGFFFYVISGVILAGAATWFWGVVRPWVARDTAEAVAAAAAPAVVYPTAAGFPARADAPSPAPPPAMPPPLPADYVDQYAESGYDRQMLYEEIRQRFSRADLNDLMFDLDINEADVAVTGEGLDQTIVRVMDAAEFSGQASTVALAVERILTPPPPEHLPRLERLSAESPRTVIRHYLLAYYGVEELQEISQKLDIDWERLDGPDKNAKTRSLLINLYRRGEIGALLDALREEPEEADAPATG